MKKKRSKRKTVLPKHCWLRWHGSKIFWLMI